MEPFSPRFLAQLEHIQKETERQSELIQRIMPRETIEMLSRVVKDAERAAAPLRSIIQTQAFQAQMRTMQDLSHQLSSIYARPAITVDDFATFNVLEATAQEVAVEIFKEPESLQLTARQIVSTTKAEVKKGRLITPLKLPLSVHWEDVRVTFVDSHTVFIEFPTIMQKITVDYMDMGMWDGRNKNPNAQWIVWRALADNSGRIDWGSQVANNQLKKQKQLLSQALSKYFNIEGDPFQTYRQVKAYELKMTLVSTGAQTLSIGEADDGVWYQYQTQSVYEKPKSGYLD